MSKFWQKKYTSKYTGAEIDAAIAKAGTVPQPTAEEYGKFLGVNSAGNLAYSNTKTLICMVEFSAEVADVTDFTKTGTVEGWYTLIIKAGYTITEETIINIWKNCGTYGDNSYAVADSFVRVTEGANMAIALATTSLGTISRT